MGTEPTATLHHGEVKEALDELEGTIHQYRKDLDAKLEGVADMASVDEKLKKIETDIFAKIDESNESLESLRRSIAAEQIKADKEAPDYESIAKYAADSSQKKIDASEFTPEWAQAYEKATRHWLREGAEGLTPELRAAMSMGSGPDGGYAVFPTIERSINQRIFDQSPITQFAATREITQGFSYKSLYKTQRGTAGWRGETQTKTETSTPKLDILEIPLHESYALPKATNWELMEGVAVFDVEQMLMDTVSEDLAILHGAAFWTGDGNLRPRGITTYTHTASGSYDNETTWKAIEYTTTGANGAFNGTDGADDIIDLIALLKPAYRQAARFFCARATLATMFKLKGSTSGEYIMLPRFDQKEGFRLTVFGYPVVEDEEVPALATDSKSLYFGDMRRAYQIARRRGMMIIRDSVTNKGFTLFDVSQFVGGGMSDFEALKALSFGS